MPAIRFLALWLITVACSPVLAAIAPEAVPAPLKPWVEWVLQGESHARCTALLGHVDARRCAWPGQLQLNLGPAGGRFTQTWQVEAESWVALPGNSEYWPQNVLIDKQPATVIARGGRPMVRLAAGPFTISGEWSWSKTPEALAIPADTGLIAVELNGVAVAQPYVDPEGRLWLGGRAAGDSPTGRPLELQVFRRITDDVPLRIETRLVARVSGQARELTLPNPLPAAATAMRLDSPLPARIERNGDLRLQLRPGEWQITLEAHAPNASEGLALPAREAPWPEAEVWSFAARPELRSAEIAGATPVSAEVAGVPADWRNLPAYRLQAGETFTIRTLQRGIGTRTQPDLRLQRELWLDFDSRAFSVRDVLEGQLPPAEWRLSALPELRIGRALLAGQPLLPTRIRGESGDGLEIRGDPLDLTVESRLETSATQPLPVSGWDAQFKGVETRLHLPPGWSLLHVIGADNIAESWLARWTLLDVFLVLVTTMAVARLWGWPWALLALLGLTLAWHEPGAPRWSWLNLIAATALMNLLPAGRPRRWMGWYRTLSWALLLAIAVPFFVQQARLALHPQLDAPVAPFQSPATTRDEPFEHADSDSDSARRQVLPAPSLVAKSSAPDAIYADSAAPTPPLSFDPGARIPTGPGMPAWRSQPIELSWQGPVTPEQTFTLILIPPWLGSTLRLAQIALLGWLALRLLRVRLPRPHGGNQLPASLGAALACVLALPVAPRPAHAEIPTPELLQELKQRLLAPPDCAPECATLAQLAIEANPAQILLRLDLHAATPVAVPLPLRPRDWPRLNVTVNAKPATGLVTTSDGQLWLALPGGRHNVVVQAGAQNQTRLELPLVLRPQRVSAALNGWQLQGVKDERATEAALHLVRLGGAATSEVEPSALPPLFEVLREVSLDREWTVTTTVRRLSPPGPPVRIGVALLPGEAVLTDGPEVAEGRLAVTVTDSATWRSSLAVAGELTLQAGDEPNLVETWRVTPAAWWHVGYAGIAPVGGAAPTLEWRPWPGERVVLEIERPEAIDGPALTIEASHLRVKPGKLHTAASLELRLRSAAGGRHDLGLPPGARIESLTIDGQQRPLEGDSTAVSLPLQPGEHRALLRWSEPRGLTPRFAAQSVELGAPAVNSEVAIELPADRWVLWAWGPRLGPAVLFWGLLLVLALLAFVLARLPITPLKGWQWFLLLVGLSQVPIHAGLIVVGWLLALGGRARMAADRAGWTFNLAQIGLVLLTGAALTLLFEAVHQGLLGAPEMQVTGNFSHAGQLRWFEDRIAGQTVTPWVLSVSVWWYRALMLAWALWLAFALLDWLRWGWASFSTHGLWKPWRTPRPSSAPTVQT